MTITPLTLPLHWAEPENSGSDQGKKTFMEGVINKINELITAINADLLDFEITGPADNDLLQYDTGTSKWVDRSLSEAGIEPSFSKNTAFNLDFGTGTTNIAEIGAILGNSQIVESNASGKLITASKNTGHNLVLGTGSGQVAEGDHDHDTVYETIANVKDWLGIGSDQRKTKMSSLIGASVNDCYYITNGAIANEANINVITSFDMPPTQQGSGADGDLYLYDILITIKTSTTGGYINRCYIYGYSASGSPTTIWSDTSLIWQSVVLTQKSIRDEGFTGADCSSYAFIIVRIDTVSSTAAKGSIQYFPIIADFYYT